MFNNGDVSGALKKVVHDAAGPFVSIIPALLEAPFSKGSYTENQKG